MLKSVHITEPPTDQELIIDLRMHTLMTDIIDAHQSPELLEAPGINPCQIKMERRPVLRHGN